MFLLNLSLLSPIENYIFTSLDSMTLITVSKYTCLHSPSMCAHPSVRLIVSPKPLENIMISLSSVSRSLNFQQNGCNIFSVLLCAAITKYLRWNHLRRTEMYFSSFRRWRNPRSSAWCHRRANALCASNMVPWCWVLWEDKSSLLIWQKAQK